MTSQAHLYSARKRAVNVELIKSILYANNQADYDHAMTNFTENLHPSLFAELDWMENTIPANQRENAREMNDSLFLNNLEKIIKLREIEFELNEDELFDEVLENRDFYSYIIEIEPKISAAFNENNYQSILNAFRQTNEKKIYLHPNRYKDIGHITEQKLSQLNDRQNLPFVMKEILLNLLALSLDHVSSRMRTRNFVRKTGMEVFQFAVGEITSKYQIDELKKMASYIKGNANEFYLLHLLESLNVIEEFLENSNILMTNKFEGEKAVGYGHCGHCAMMFSSCAIISLDPTCPYLIEQSGALHLPLKFNTAQCPFCGQVRRIDTPAMFYRPSNKKVIYNIPTHNQYSEAEAENFYAELIGELKERYKKRISPEEAEAFDNAGEEITYNMAHFLTAIQMGTVNKVWHTFIQVGLADGSALLVDKTTSTIIDLIDPAEVEQMWDLSTDDPAMENLSQDKNINMQLFRDAKEDYGKGDYKKAERLFTDLYGSNPDNAIICRYLASVYLYQGKKKMAEELINKK
jgi:hypothetical protein